MFAEEGIYKLVGCIVIVIFVFVLICKLLGFQGRIIEGLSNNDSLSSKRSSNSSSNSMLSMFSTGENANSGSPGDASEAANKHTSKSNQTKHDAKVASDREGQENMITALDSRVRDEILAYLIDSTKDGEKHISPLLKEGVDLIKNPESMKLIMNLNELYKFLDVLEHGMGTLDATPNQNQQTRMPTI